MEDGPAADRVCHHKLHKQQQNDACASAMLAAPAWTMTVPTRAVVSGCSICPSETTRKVDGAHTAAAMRQQLMPSRTVKTECSAQSTAMCSGIQ